MNTSPSHHCPSCGKVQNPVLRYPWYICRDCLKLAEDYSGRRLKFANVSLFGGFSWRYADNEKSDYQICHGVICLIKGRNVMVSEAKFGGIVAEPVFNLAVYPSHWVERNTNLSKLPVPDNS